MGRKIAESSKSETVEGYWVDAKGSLIPEAMIKDIDKIRDLLVHEQVQKAIAVQEVLKEFKAQIFGEISAFVDMSAELYDVKIGGKKGNTTLYTFDGRYKIQRAISEHIAFDERIQAAKKLIDECFQEWTKDSRSEIKTLIERAFDVDKEGNLNTGSILALRRVGIEDPRWLRAMDAISESVQVVGSKSYVRLYERVGDSDKYEPIVLDVAGV